VSTFSVDGGAFKISTTSNEQFEITKRGISVHFPGKTENGSLSLMFMNKDGVRGRLVEFEANETLPDGRPRREHQSGLLLMDEDNIYLQGFASFDPIKIRAAMDSLLSTVEVQTFLNSENQREVFKARKRD